MYKFQRILTICFYSSQGPFVQVDKLMESLSAMSFEEETQNGKYFSTSDLNKFMLVMINFSKFEILLHVK